MSDIIDISALHKQFKEERNKLAFVEAQHKTIHTLKNVIEQQKAEIEHLKELLVNSVPIEGHNVERVIVTVEEALCDDQIKLIQQRSIGVELSLEDVKKLDLLIKNKRLIDEKKSDVESTARKVVLPNSSLLSIIDGNNK